MTTKNAKGIDDKETVDDAIADPAIDRVASADVETETEIAPDEIDTWAGKLGVSERRLREAIQRAGPMVRDVRHFLVSHPT